MNGFAVRIDGVYGCRPVADESECLPFEIFSLVFVPYVPTTDDLFSALRAARDARIARTDKILLPDYPISAADLEAVKTYRAALRDIPAQPGAPWDGGGTETPWPELPKT